MRNRYQVMAVHDDAVADDDEIIGACTAAALDVVRGVRHDDAYTFGAKVEELRKKLDKLRARIEKLEAKESKGPFAKMQDKLREKRLARLEKKAEKLEAQLEAAEDAQEGKDKAGCCSGVGCQSCGYGYGAEPGTLSRGFSPGMAPVMAFDPDPDARDRLLHYQRTPAQTSIAWAPNLVTGARSDGQWVDPDARDRALHNGLIR